MQQAYQSGLERRAFCVLGKMLAPLTLGHLRLLYGAETPYVNPQAAQQPTIGDLAFAVMICSFADWKQAHRNIISSSAQWAAAKFGARCALMDFQSANETMLEYFGYYISTPRIFTDRKQTVEYVPLPWMLAGILRNTYAMTEDEVWRVIVSDAMSWNAVRLRMNGFDGLMSELDLKMEQRAIEQAAAMGAAS